MEGKDVPALATKIKNIIEKKTCKELQKKNNEKEAFIKCIDIC